MGGGGPYPTLCPGVSSSNKKQRFIVPEFTDAQIESARISYHIWDEISPV